MIKKFIAFALSVILINTQGSNAQETDSFQVFSKYDFIPGEKVIFFEDFSVEAIGDFPVRWNTNGSGEIVTASKAPGRWFQMKTDGYYIPETSGDFPENFTVEFDWIPTGKDDDPESSGMDIGLFLVSGKMSDPNEGGAIPGVAGNKLNFTKYTSYYASYADGEYKVEGNADFELFKNRPYRISIWVQKQRLRIYINETKLIDAPRAMPAGFKYNILRFEIGGESAPLIANFRVAAGLPDLRSKLLTEGKLVSYGIYFDVASDKLKPHSYATLKEISQVLKENAALKIKIVGHTDSDGEDAANLDLSKRRALAVKNELVKSFGLDATRIETDGKGESQPVAPNDNLTNKAMNRRVEFIRL